MLSGSRCSRVLCIVAITFEWLGEVPYACFKQSSGRYFTNIFVKISWKFKNNPFSSQIMHPSGKHVSKAVCALCPFYQSSTHYRWNLSHDS